jgi:uncharacterized protein (DUF427 family)
VEPTGALIRVEFADAVVAETTRALRVLETSHPPTIYIPRLDIDEALLRPARLVTFCEFKGEASYLDLRVSDRVSSEAAWEYRDPSERFKSLIGHVAFYPGRVDACFIDGEPVKAQDGGLYGGWITSTVVGPFKGSPGSRDW